MVTLIRLGHFQEVQLRNHKALWIPPAVMLLGFIYFGILHEAVGLTLLFTGLLIWLPASLCVYLFKYILIPDQRSLLKMPICVTLAYCLIIVIWINWSINVVSQRRENAKAISRKASQ